MTRCCSAGTKAGVVGLAATGQIAAAIIGTPVAIAMATTLGVDPRTFVLAVLFGCNICYATPMAYQTNLLVMSAAGYRFKDFIRVGLPLAVLMWITLTWLLAQEYNLL